MSDSPGPQNMGLWALQMIISLWPHVVKFWQSARRTPGMKNGNARVLGRREKIYLRKRIFSSIKNLTVPFLNRLTHMSKILLLQEDAEIAILSLLPIQRRPTTLLTTPIPSTTPPKVRHTNCIFMIHEHVSQPLVLGNRCKKARYTSDS
jgi:hypothetical protein